MDYKLTILMPLYNRQDYLCEAIDSVLAQKTNFNYQLIVIDDASTDDGVKIVESYIEKYPDKIVLLKNKTNLKLLRTILRGYENLTTDYFCVLDPDDYWIDEYKLQKAVDFLESNPDYTIYATDTYVLNEDGSKKLYINIKKSYINSDFNDYIKDKAALGCSLGGVFRNVIFKQGVPSSLYDMIDSKYASAFRGDSFRNILHIKEGKAHFVNEADAIYRIHSDGIWSNLSQFKQNLITAKFYLGMYHYFDKSLTEFCLERRLRLYNNYLKDAVEIMKSERNNDELTQDVAEMLDLVHEFQREYILYKKQKDKQTLIEDQLDSYIKNGRNNNIFYKIIEYINRRIRGKGLVE